jgi:hypothetical protein
MCRLEARTAFRNLDGKRSFHAGVCQLWLRIVQGFRNNKLMVNGGAAAEWSSSPARKLLRRDDFPPALIVHHTSGLLMKPPCEFFRGANPLHHKPGTDNVAVLDFNGVTAQRRASVFAYLTELLQQACHDRHVERPEDDYPAVFQRFDIEVPDGQLVDQGVAPLRIGRGHLSEYLPSYVRNPQ